jgi:superfamily II DNA or RNA helicase
MIHFVFTEKDRRYVFLKYDTELEYDILHNKLTEYINLVDPICYLPTYTGKPFTNDFLFEYTQPSGNIIFYCAIGLCSTIAEWLKKNDLPFDGLDKKWFRRPIKHTYEQFKEIVNSWNMSRTPREYQYDTAYKILQRFQCVAELSTRAGKTLIAYMIFRYAIEHLGAKRILMIVPSIDLVKQGYNDFSDYAEFFKTECLWGGGKIVESSNLTIATFQTLINFLNKDSKKYNPKFFDTYDMVFVDETHRATASSIKTIISQPFMRNLKIAFGMTGTLPKEGTTERYCVHALLGARIVAIAPRELMDAGYLSQVKIYQHCISYKNKEKQLDTWIRCAEYCISDFDETVNAKGKKERIPLEHPDFLIAYKKTFPAMLAEAKTKIFAQET